MINNGLQNLKVSCKKSEYLSWYRVFELVTIIGLYIYSQIMLLIVLQPRCDLY